MKHKLVKDMQSWGTLEENCQVIVIENKEYIEGTKAGRLEGGVEGKMVRRLTRRKDGRRNERIEGREGGRKEGSWGRKEG